jgi:Disulfide bond formation protein DsbB
MSQPSPFDVPSSGVKQSPSGVPIAWGLLALLIAAVGVGGSLYLSIGMGLKACPLCFYQRSFVMGVLAVLLIGLLADRSRLGLLFLLSAVMAVAGLGVASFHVYLVTSGKLECPAGIYGIGDAPTQSLALFSLLAAVTLIGSFLGRHDSRLGPAGVLLAIVLGGAMAYGCIASSPPLPKPKPPEGPFDTCRPPWTGEPAK